MSNWLRTQLRRRRWRKDAKRSADVIREFVYLDEVSVFSLLASKDGMIAAEITDTRASTLMGEVSGTYGASAGVLRAEAGVKTQSTDARTTQVLRKAIVQSTFRDLYDRVHDNLAIALAPPAEHAPQIEVGDVPNADGLNRWIIDPTALHRGHLIELTVELEAEALYQARTVMRTFLDIFEQEQALLGMMSSAELAEAAVVSRVIEKLGAGLVPLRARAKDYLVATDSAGSERIVHRQVVESLGATVRTEPLYIVGVATEALFWKDIRSVVFSRSEFQVLARLLRPALQDTWTPLKLVDVLARVAPQIYDAVETMNDVIFAAMTQTAVAANGPAQVRAVLAEYAELIADALNWPLDRSDSTLNSMFEPPTALNRDSPVTAWRLAMSPIETYVSSMANASVDPSLAAELRVLAQIKQGMSILDNATRTPPPPSIGPKNRDRLLESEIIAIYW